jgi:hypothetical protein
MADKLPKRSWISIVSPQQAVAWLDNSPGNRPIRQDRVEELCRALLAGEWEFNGESIKFDDRGQLLDGHHRLMACVKANRSFETVIVEGIKSKAKPTVDIGAPRSLSDTLVENDQVSTATLGSTLTRLIRFECQDENSSLGFASNRDYVSPARALRYLRENPEVKDAVRDAHGLRTVVAASRVAWLIFLTRRAFPKKSKEFFDALEKGSNLPDHHPAFVLRNRLNVAKGDRKARLRDAEYSAMMIKAWNAFVQDKPLTPRGMAWRIEAAGNSKPEAFPTLILD